jgi:preprotein translocase subunit SecA
MFDEMIESIQQATVRTIYRIAPKNKLEREQVAKNISTNSGEATNKRTVKHQVEN